MARPTGTDPALARVVRRCRDQSGLSQEAVARDSGLTVGAFARIERGEANPSWTTVRSIAAALGVSLADLGHALDREDDAEANQ